MTTMLLCAAAHAQTFGRSGEVPTPITFDSVGEFGTFLALLTALVVVTMVLRNVMREGRFAL